VIEKNCLGSAKADADRFVDCMMDSTKKIEKQQQKFEFKMAFLQTKVYECFQKQSQETKDYEPCKQKASKDI